MASSCSLDINWLAVYTVSSNYRNSMQGRHEKISCRKLIVGEQLAVLSPRLCENGGDKPQDRG